MQIIKYYCDNCGQEIKDGDKNAVLVGDVYCNDSVDGAHKRCSHTTRLFCENCSFKLLALTFSSDEADYIAYDWLGEQHIRSGK